MASAGILDISDWLEPAFQWLMNEYSRYLGFEVGPNLLTTQAIRRMAEWQGLFTLSPLSKHIAETPYDLTIEDMEEIYEAGYDLEIRDGLLCGWRKRDE